MTNSPNVRSALAHAALKELVPPLIRETLIEESEFRKEYSFKTTSDISFGDSGVSVQRSILFEAVRKILSGTSTEEVTDKGGQKWELKNTSGEGKLPRLTLYRTEQSLVLPDYNTLSPDSSIRLSSLEKAASEDNLPRSVREEWHNILSERALEDEEVNAFHNEFRDTPVHRARSIRNEITNGQNSTLVPLSRRFFQRLVGKYEGSASIRDYASGSAKTLFQELSAWRPYDGILFSLFLSSHSALTDEINVDQLSSEDLVSAFEFLDKHGDRISQLGAIEVGLRILPSKPEIESILIHLIKQIRDDDINENVNGFKLLSALFAFVDGHLSRTRLLSAEPPFYRRLAALSQAALIHRQLLNSTVDLNEIYEWVVDNSDEQFYLQSLADMRIEPSWHPGLAAASQMKADFFGRIMIAANNYKENIKDGELSMLVFGAQPGSLNSLSEFPLQYFRGPLERAEDTSNILPTSVSKTIETQIGADEVEPSSFIVLVNSAMLFHVGVDQAELAAKTLKSASYRLANIENRTQFLNILSGLATVAAVARSRMLVNELRILVRRYRRDAQYVLSIQEALRICLVAAASFSDLSEWRDFVGDWLTELAFGDLEGNDGKVLHSHLLCLCHAVPELWVSCGRADAALKAFNAL